MIRPAREEDFEDLCDIIAQVDELHREHLPRRFRAPDGPARSGEFLLQAIENAEVGLFVAEVERSLTGFVHVVIREAPDIPIVVPRRYAVVDNLAVKNRWRRTGVGRALMKRAEDWASAQEASSLELNVYAFNRPAAAFYEALGYKTLSHRMVKRLD